MRSFLFDTHFHLDLIPDGEKAKAEILNNGIYTIAVTNLPDLFMKEVTNDSKYINQSSQSSTYNIEHMWVGNQSQYDALETKDARTLFIII